MKLWLILVAATPSEALNSALMGFFEKRKFRNFLIFLSNYEKDKPSTYLKGVCILIASQCLLC